MRIALLAGILLLAASAVAFLQFSAAVQLRQELVQTRAQLSESEAVRAQLEEQIVANTAQQALFRQQIANLRENLQSSTAALGTLSSSLQEARELVQDNSPTVQASQDDTQ